MTTTWTELTPEAPSERIPAWMQPARSWRDNTPIEDLQGQLDVFGALVEVDERMPAVPC